MDSFAKRLRSIRGYLSLSRKEFEKRYGVPETTLKGWELEKSKITKTQLRKLLNAFSRENIPCTDSWLIEGIGTFPFLKEFSRPEKKRKGVIQKEIDFFLQNNSSSITQIIGDKRMVPFYDEGDYVGGIETNVSSLKKEDHLKPMIVFVKDTFIPLIRFVVIDDNKINLTYANTSVYGFNHLIDVTIEKLYQIVWHRKPLGSI